MTGATVLVLGDAHADDPGNRERLRSAYENANANVALQAGDLGHYDPPTPTWFVAGNNEDFDIVDALRQGTRPPDVAPHLHLLASTAAEVAGLRVAGLSGNFAPTQFDRPRSALSGDRRRHFVREDVERLCRLGSVDILLVHSAPHGLLYFGYDPGSDPIDTVIRALTPTLCLVGHYHRHAETVIDETQVVSLAPVWDRYYTLDVETFDLESHPTPEDG